MKKVIVFIIMIVLLVLDNSFCPFIAVKGAAPSLLFIFAIAYSIIKGKNEAVFVGVVSGLLQDIYFINGFGINTLVNLYCCYIAASIGQNIWKEKKVVPSITVLGISIFKYYIIYLILYSLNVDISSIRGIIIGLYNCIIMFFTYGLIFNKCKEEHNETSWRFK